MLFRSCGFEHSVANMSILGVGLLNPGEELITVGGYVQNLVFVTIGNLVGGVCFVALPYHFIAKEK